MFNISLPLTSICENRRFFYARKEVSAMEFEVRITVTQTITVPVEAESMQQARVIAESNWFNDEYIHSESHSRLRKKHTEFETLYPESRPISPAIIQPYGSTKATSKSVHDMSR